MRKAFELLSFIDDVEEVMQLIEEEKGEIPSLLDTTKEDLEMEEDEEIDEEEEEVDKEEEEEEETEGQNERLFG